MGRERKRGKAPSARRTCGTMAVHHRLLETVPGFRGRQSRLEGASVLRGARAERPDEARIVTIPVVVHVVYNLVAENIPAAQVRSQIQVLTRDFRARNPDQSKVPGVWKGLASDARIQFALARTDPAGRATTGIIRTRTSRASFGDDEAVKSKAEGGADAWPSSRYLNIWVCNLEPWLGYAQFPGGPAVTDGVVVLHSAFGTRGTAVAPFALGRTATHEVGHWLNLRHIWADTEDCRGTDLVADTPNAQGPNYGKPAFPHVTCGNGPSGDMFMNYMDYVDDDSMFMFTTQQVLRMRTALEDVRPGIGA